MLVEALQGDSDVGGTDCIIMLSMKNTQITKTCVKCNKSFNVKAYRDKTAHYCSKECWSTRNPPPERTCPTCGKLFNSRDKRAKFCSRKCATLVRVGEKAGAWKGGTSLNSKRSKARGELSIWRKNVYERDNHTCQHCGSVGGSLHAHHVKPVSEYESLMLDVSNGITLCVKCHEEVHGRKLTTPASFKKHCVICGAKTSGRGMYCRPCSIRKSWEKRKIDHLSNTGIIPV